MSVSQPQSDRRANEFRRRDAERNAAVILEAAARLLADDPHVGMAAIADAAGVTRITVNRHFRTRENLVAAVVESMLSRARAVLQEARIEEGTASEALERLVRGWLRVGALSLPREVVEQGTGGLAPEVQQRYFERDLGAPLVALMERGRTSREFTDMPAEWMARLLGATLQAARDAVAGGSVRPDDVPELVLASLLGGLRGRPPVLPTSPDSRPD